MKITYQFALADGSRHRFEVDSDRPAAAADARLPAWTALAHRQCPHCPLQPVPGALCPAAADLAPAIASFAKVISYERAQVTVETPERTVAKECQVQLALSSLVALIMATSACPILARMRGLALTHLPFATMEETLFRVVGAYLVRQLLIHRQGGNPDLALDGLKAHYADLEILNRSFKTRITTAASKDSTLNAVAALGALSMGVGMFIDDSMLGELSRFAVPSE